MKKILSKDVVFLRIESSQTTLHCNSCGKKIEVGVPYRFGQILKSKNSPGAVACSRRCERFYKKHGQEHLDGLLSSFEKEPWGMKPVVEKQEALDKQRCWWNGEMVAYFSVVSYLVRPNETTQTHWQNRIVGEIRQGVFLHINDNMTLFDNEHGDFYEKVMLRYGSPNISHKVVSNYEVLEHLPVTKVNKMLYKDRIKQEEEQHNEWLKDYFPDTYNKLQALKSLK